MIVDLIILAVVLFIAISVGMEKLPRAIANSGNVKALELQNSSYKSDLKECGQHLRLAKSDITCLNGRIAGLEIELEATQKEADHWEQIAKQRRALLEKRGVYG